MRYLLLSGIFTLGLFHANCQIRDLMLAPYKEKGKWGFIDAHLDTICPPKYERIWTFSNARARFRKKKKYGYLDYKGNVAIRPVYDHARPFRYGVATVRKGKRSFRIDTDGKKFKGVVEHRGRNSDLDDYVNARDISDHIIRYGNKYGLRFRRSSKHDIDAIYLYDTLSIQFDSIFTLGFQAICLVRNDMYAIIDCNAFHWGSKHVIDQMNFEFEEVKLFDKRGMHHRLIGVRHEGLWGYFDLFSGDLIIEPKYLDIEAFSGDMAIVEYQEGNSGYINTFGIEFFNNPAAVKQDVPEVQFVPANLEPDRE